MPVAPVLLGSQGWCFRESDGSPSPQADANLLDRLRAYANEFSTVEVHDTFIGLPPECVLRDWRECVPEEFVFSLTLPQQITHEGRLVGSEPMLGRFLERVAALETNIGPILIRVPSGFRHTSDNFGVLSSFVAKLSDGYRWAIEFRSADWLLHEVLDLLRGRNVALALPDGRFLARTMLLDLATTPTADFAYVRWNAPPRSPQNGTDAARHNEVLSPWLIALRELRGKTGAVFGYFGYPLHPERLDIIRECQGMVDGVRARPATDVATAPRS